MLTAIKKQMRQRLAYFILLFLIFPCGFAQATPINVFTTAMYPMNTSDVPSQFTIRVFKIGRLKQIINRLNIIIQGADPVIARQRGIHYLKTHHAELQQAALGLNLMYQYHIKRLPAIVFDNGNYIVLGQTNLDMAIQSYKQWLQQVELQGKLNHVVS